MCATLNHIGILLILAFVVTGCVWISAFASLFGVLNKITSSAVALKICAITSGIEKDSQ